MVKLINQVKTKQQLQRLLSEIHVPFGKELITDWINLDPIYVGDPNKAEYESSIRKHLLDTVDKITLTGNWCEFGVRDGRSLNWIIEHKPLQKIYGFDSWEGLPEEWDHGLGKTDSMKCDPPNVPEHIELIKGLFQDTLPTWKENHPDPIAFLHMDADIYSSTFYVLNELNDQIVPGTIITFDEFCNFRLSGKMSYWKKHEFRALVEWMQEKGRKIKPLSRNWAYQASCIVL